MEVSRRRLFGREVQREMEQRMQMSACRISCTFATGSPEQNRKTDVLMSFCIHCCPDSVLRGSPGWHRSSILMLTSTLWSWSKLQQAANGDDLVWCIWCGHKGHGGKWRGQRDMGKMRWMVALWLTNLVGMGMNITARNGLIRSKSCREHLLKE